MANENDASRDKTLLVGLAASSVPALPEGLPALEPLFCPAADTSRINVTNVASAGKHQCRN
ncbi:hypothetical protein GSR05_29955 (plasmid) [Klebsiella pneumoniae]|nr:hypothetical protein GSR05_29955 [Klebsiella pneumoniae]